MILINPIKSLMSSELTIINKAKQSISLEKFIDCRESQLPITSSTEEYKFFIYGGGFCKSVTLKINGDRFSLDLNR